MLRTTLALAFVGLVVVPSTSCRPAAVGKINHQGYVHEKYSYRLAPKDVSASGILLMDPDWLLDSHYAKKGKFVEKRTNEYMERLTVDGDNDGKWEFSGDVPIYDLRFLHRNRDAVIWLRTLPLSGWQRDKDLAVLMQSLVESVAGAGYERVRIHPKTVIVEEKRFAAVTVKSGPGRIADTDAFFAHVDVANLDQLRLQPDASTARVELVLLKPAVTHSVPRADGSKMELPVLMIAGYKNSPDAFDRDLPAFRELLGRLEVDGKQGLTPPTFSATPMAPAAPDPPVAPLPATTAPTAPAPASPDPNPATPATPPAEPSAAPPPAEAPPAAPTTPKLKSI
jgi:hypothetical protein